MAGAVAMLTMGAATLRAQIAAPDVTVTPKPVGSGARAIGMGGAFIAVADDATYFSFASTGLGRPNVGGNTAVSQVVMCDERGNIVAAGGNSAGRLFVVTPLGRATIIRDTTMIGNALTAMNKTCP